MKIKAVVWMWCTILAVGVLLLSSRVHAQGTIVREHSASNRSGNSTSVEDKQVPQEEALSNVSSVPLGETECENAPSGSVPCFGADGGEILKQRIVTKSVVVRPQSEAENSIIEKIVITPQTVDVEGAVVRAVEPQSVSPVDDPTVPSDVEAPQVAVPDTQQNPIPPIATAEAVDSEEAVDTEIVTATVPVQEPTIDSQSTLADADEAVEQLQDQAIDVAAEDDVQAVDTELSSANVENVDTEIFDTLQATSVEDTDTGAVEVGDVVENDAIDAPDVATSNRPTEGDVSVDLVPPVVLNPLPDLGVDAELANSLLSSDDVEREVTDDSGQIDIDGVAEQSTSGDDGESNVSTIASASTAVAPDVSSIRSGDSSQTAATTDELSVVDEVATPSDVDSVETVVASAVDSGSDPDIPLAPGSDIAQQIALADRLLTEGQATRARQVLTGIDTTQPLPPQIAQTGAVLATNLNLFQVARRLWEQNVTESEPYQSTALTALVDLAVSTGSLAGADIYLQSMLKNNIVPSEGALLAVADYYLDSARFDEASELLTLFSEVYPNSQYFDGLLWNRGRLYEMHPNQQNVWSAVQDYRELVAAYPLSNYWEQAQARATYLERHFIDVR